MATVKRDGAQWEMRFKQGKPLGALKKLGAARGTGTTVYFRPDAAIFPKIEFEPDVIKDRLEVASFLHKGVKVVFDDETSKQKTTFEHANGLLDYLKKIVGDRGAKRCTRRRFVLSKDEGLGSISCCNGPKRPTSTSGRKSTASPPAPAVHENGLRAGIGKAVRFHRHAQFLAEGRHAGSGGHPGRPDRRPERVRCRSRSFRGRPRID